MSFISGNVPQHRDFNWLLNPSGDEGTILFQDLMEGTGGTNFVTHTPDIAPTGFAYRQDLGAGALNGLGQMNGTGSLDANFDSTNSVPAFTIALAYPYYVEFVGQAFPAGLNEVAEFRIKDTRPGRGHVRVRVGCNGSGISFAEGTVENGTESGQTVTYGAVFAAHTVRVLCEAANSSVYIDGVLVGTIARIGPEQINLIEVKAAREGGAGNFCLIGPVRVVQL